MQFKVDWKQKFKNYVNLIYLNEVKKGVRTSVTLGVASVHGPASVASDVIMRMTS